MNSKKLRDASNYFLIDNFSDKTLNGWEKNEGITCMETSSFAFEGGYSLKVSYCIDESKGINVARVSKKINEDASSFNGISFRINGPDKFIRYRLRIEAEDAYWETGILYMGRNEWKWIFLPWSDFRKANDYSRVAVCRDMKNVKAFCFELIRPLSYDSETVLTGTFYLDEIRFVENRIDDFEHGLCGWNWNSCTYVNHERNISECYEGTGAIKCECDFNEKTNEVKSTLEKDLTNTIDGREFNGISMWVKGDKSGNLLSVSIVTIEKEKKEFKTRPVKINFTGYKQLFFFWGQFYKGDYEKLTLNDIANIKRVRIEIIKDKEQKTVIHIDYIHFTTRLDLFANMNLDMPGLEQVKKNVNEYNYESAKKELLSYMQNRVKPRYYLQWEDKKEIMKMFNSYYPGEIKIIEERAQRAKRYDFTFEGQRRWLDPDGDNHINWYQGNSTFTSVLSSMEWWSEMGIAYWNSWLNEPDESYVTSFAAQLKDFVENCPPPNAIIFNLIMREKEMTYFLPYGNLWISLFIGVRMLNWCSAYAFFSKSGSFTAENNFVFLSSLLEHAECIYDLEGAYINDNFQLVECSGLYTVSILFPEFKKAELWKKLAKYYIELHMDDNVLNDGFYKELTFGYHEWMIETFCKVKLLGDINSDSFSENFINKLEKMFEVDLKLMRSNGSVPMVSDSSTEDKRHIMSLGAALFKRGDFKYLSSGKVSCNHFWILPKEMLDNFYCIEKKEPNFTSVKLEDSGYYYMRVKWNGKENELFFDGAPYLTGHYHHDILNIDVASYGDTLIIDPGKGNYSDYEYYQHFFVSTEGHNTIRMDDYENPHHVIPVEKKWETCKEYDFIDMEVDYAKIVMPGLEESVPFCHRRKIFFAKPEYWIMNDIVTVKGVQGMHSFEQSFHLAPMAISVNKSTKAVLVNNFIDCFDTGRLESYECTNCIISTSDVGPHKSKKSLMIYLKNPFDEAWFVKKVDYNAQFVNGIAFWIKSSIGTKAVKPFIVTESGKWILFYNIILSVETGVWSEIFLPWRMFLNEKQKDLCMSPYEASRIKGVGFYVKGDKKGEALYLSELRFYKSFDICNFESRLIDTWNKDNEDWQGFVGKVEWNEKSCFKEKKCIKYACDFSKQDYDYVRKIKKFDGSKLGGIMAYIKGALSLNKMCLYIKSSTGLWKSSKEYSLNYDEWRLYYFPWRNFVEVNTKRQMEAKDAFEIEFIEFRFLRGDPEKLYPIVYIESVGLFDYFQEKNLHEIGIEGWTSQGAYISLDPNVKLEGDHSLKVEYGFSRENHEVKVKKYVTQFVSYDLYRGISLWIKGDGSGNKLRVLVNNYISPEIYLSKEEWKIVYIPWEKFRLEENESITLDEAPSYIESIELRIIKSEISTRGVLYVDNITLIGKDMANLTIIPVDPLEIDEVNTYFGWISYSAERYECAPYVKYKKSRVNGSTTFDTIIYPGKPGIAPEILVSRMPVYEQGKMVSTLEATGIKISIKDENGAICQDLFLINHNDEKCPLYKRSW